MQTNPRPTMGCARCWPESAEAAWQGRADLERRFELADDSHFHVMILGCKGCGQPYLSVFTELTDLMDGDDSQGWVLLPITASELQQLTDAPANEIEHLVYATGTDRASLLKIHARGHEANIFWSFGVPMLPHG